MAVMLDFVRIFVPLFLQQTVARFPCANNGEPILNAEKATDGTFSCRCPAEYFGTFCEYQTSSADDGKSKADQQQQNFAVPTRRQQQQQQQHSTLVDRFGILFPRYSESVSGSTERRASNAGWEDVLVNLLVCVFFLLILPSLVVYIVRVLYLLLKRCHHRPPATTATRQMEVPTPPPQYYASPEGNFRLRPNPSGRHRSESPGVTEVTVQLPASICRPLHGTHSLNLRPTTSLTLNEFHGLLLAMQREMVAEQRRERETRIRLAPLAESEVSSAIGLPVNPPPNYESALLSPRYP